MPISYGLPIETPVSGLDVVVHKIEIMGGQSRRRQGRCRVVESIFKSGLDRSKFRWGKI